MNKIKKFKISLRRKSIAQKILRANLDLKAAGIDNELELDKFIVSLYSSLNPGVVYRLFDGAPLELEALGLNNKEIFSACVLTLGSETENRISQMPNSHMQTAANIALFEFLRAAAQFAAELIKEQAGKEDFETDGFEILYAPSFAYAQEPKFLSDAPRTPPETAAKILPAVFESVNTAKINAAFENGAVTPKATVAFFAPWKKLKRKNK
ncbi:MAG: hypothetical protein LBI01_04750 [Elusimicrobium sp.]|jgi:hypothetical protein|nr:hypothetical protein [Elusimicrobium sp.]